MNFSNAWSQKKRWLNFTGQLQFVTLLNDSPVKLPSVSSCSLWSPILSFHAAKFMIQLFSFVSEWSQRKLEATEKPSYSYSLDRGLKWREKDAFTNSIGLLWMYSYYSTDILTTSRAYTSTESFTDFIFHSVTESSSALSYDTINDTSSSMYHFMLQQFQHLSVYPFIFFVPVVVRYLIQCIFA